MKKFIKNILDKIDHETAAMITILGMVVGFVGIIVLIDKFDLIIKL